jgi:hypothetical protein
MRGDCNCEDQMQIYRIAQNLLPEIILLWVGQISYKIQISFIGVR